MKRIFFLALCVCIVVVAGCSPVNQTNRFVELSPADTQQLPGAADTAQPATPAQTQPPTVQLEIQPTDMPAAVPEASESPVPTHTPTVQPDATDTQTPAVTPTPAGSPGGFNG